eukprot:gene10912-7570_t
MALAVRGGTNGAVVTTSTFDEAEFDGIIQAAVDAEATSLNIHHKSDMLKLPVSVKRTRDTLELLHLDNNYRLGALPRCIGDFPRLRWLNASYCRIKSIAPEIGKLSKLERLHLSNNVIEFLPTELWQLKSLEELRVNENELHFLPDGLLFLPKLRELAVVNNPFYTQDEIEGADAVTLVPPQKSIDCANCRIRVRNYLVSITFHNMCGHKDLPFVHFCCSEKCQELLNGSLATYDKNIGSKIRIVPPPGAAAVVVSEKTRGKDTTTTNNNNWALPVFPLITGATCFRKWKAKEIEKERNRERMSESKPEAVPPRQSLQGSPYPFIVVPQLYHTYAGDKLKLYLNLRTDVGLR